MNLVGLIQPLIVFIIGTIAISGILWMMRKRKPLATLRFADIPFGRHQLLSRRLGSFTRRTNRALRFHTPGGEIDNEQQATYEIWNNKLPMTRKVLEQVRGLAKSSEPFFGVLVSSHPPTIGMTENGPMPLVTRLIAVKDLDPSNFDGVSPEDLVATFHTHQSKLEVLKHDESTFRIIDAFAGSRIHIIGSMNGLQFYHARHSLPAINRNNNSEVR